MPYPPLGLGAARSLPSELFGPSEFGEEFFAFMFFLSVCPLHLSR
jgi:hypothetical protein